MSKKSFRLVAAVGIAATALGMSFLPATAAPGNPGVPAAPTTLLAEAFESGLSGGSGVLIGNYTGGSYEAGAYWSDPAQGNGLVIDGTTSDAAQIVLGFTTAASAHVAGGTYGDRLRALATALGTFNGSSPATANHAVTAWSSTGTATDTLEFRTNPPLTLPGTGRFLTLSANVAAISCHVSHPQLNFFLAEGGVENQVNTAALDPCPAGNNHPAAEVFTESLTGGSAALFTGNGVDVIIRNANTSSSGNDHAYDDIRVLDVTPQLDKVFEDAGLPLALGDVTNLTLSVTNTSELGEKKGWSFTDKLPAGLTVAGAATSTCDAATIAADDGDKEIVVTEGSLGLGDVSCAITIPIMATKPGTYSNSAANITSVGLNAPGASKVTYVDPAPVKDEVVPADPSVPAGGEGSTNDGVSLLGMGLGMGVLGGAALALAGLRRRTAS